MNASEKSIKLSLSTQKQLNSLFTRIGDIKRSKGALNSIYERSRRQLLADFANIDLIRTVFTELLDDTLTLVDAVFFEAAELGITQVEETFEIFELPEPTLDVPSEQILEYENSVESFIIRQRQIYLGLVIGGGVTREFLLGEKDKYWGTLSPKGLITSIKNLTAGILNSIFESILVPEGYAFQAIAIIDDKTSETCKSVDGQIQPPGKPFHLTAMPRYADFIIKPPFHDGCRTTRALVKLDQVLQ